MSMKFKKIIFQALVFTMLFSTGISVHAESNTGDNSKTNVELQTELIPLNQFENVTIEGELPSISSKALSATKTKTKSLYTTTGKKIGTATLKYKTDIVSGRPQFVYSETKLGWNITATDYAVDNPKIYFTGDLVKVIFPLNLWGLTDKATVTFTP